MKHCAPYKEQFPLLIGARARALPPVDPFYKSDELTDCRSIERNLIQVKLYVRDFLARMGQVSSYLIQILGHLDDHFVIEPPVCIGKLANESNSSGPVGLDRSGLVGLDRSGLVGLVGSRSGRLDRSGLVGLVGSRSGRLVRSRSGRLVGSRSGRLVGSRSGRLVGSRLGWWTWRDATSS